MPEENMNFIRELPNDISVDELIATLKHNVTVANDMRNRCELLRQIKEDTPSSISKEANSEAKSGYLEENDELTEEDVEDFYAFYYKPIINLDHFDSLEQTKKEIIELLPDSKNKQFSSIIGRIQLELLIAEKEYLELLKPVQDSLNSDDVDFSKQLENEITFLRLKREIIKEYVATLGENLKTTNESNDFTSNHLIYMPTVTGNLYVNNDLLAIPIDYYSSFKDLFTSIQDGTFKGFKRLVGGDITSSGIGISEVKDYQSRIVFDRIGSKSFAILDVFVKKVDLDKEYMESLAGRVHNYRRIKPELVKAIQDPEFLRQQDEITEEILTSLTEKNRDKVRAIGRNRGEV